METLKFLMISTHFPPYHVGGDAIFVSYLAKELIRAGHEVHVAAAPDAYDLIRGRAIESNPSDDSSGLTLHQHRHYLGKMGPVISLVLGEPAQMRQRLLGLAMTIRADIVHWHNTRGFIGTPFTVPGAACLYTAHDYYAVCPRGSLLRPGGAVCRSPLLCQFCLIGWKKPPQLWRSGGRRTLRIPREVVMLSPSEFLAKRFAVDGIRIDYVLRNFVLDKVDLAREREGFDKILFLGLLETYKGPQILLEAFHKSRNEQGFELLIAGEGPLKARLLRRVGKLGLENRTNIPGYVPLDNLAPVLRRAAAVVIPTDALENAPLVALEALSMGIPIIGSNSGGLPEILGSESGSMVFQPGDVDELANCLISIWAEKDKLVDRGKMARKAYLANFSPESHMRQYMNIIRKAESSAHQPNS